MTRGFSGDKNNAPEIIKKREKKPRPRDIYIYSGLPIQKKEMKRKNSVLQYAQKRQQKLQSFA